MFDKEKTKLAAVVAYDAFRAGAGKSKTATRDAMEYVKFAFGSVGVQLLQEYLDAMKATEVKTPTIRVGVIN
jgi:hypothetical protein